MESDTVEEPRVDGPLHEAEKPSVDMILVSETKPQHDDQECTITEILEVRHKKRKCGRQRSMRSFIPSTSVYEPTWDDEDKGRVFIGKGEHSPYMRWDYILVAMVYEIYDHHGFSAADTVGWFKRWFPRIKNFDRLKPSTVRPYHMGHQWWLQESTRKKGDR